MEFTKIIKKIRKKSWSELFSLFFFHLRILTYFKFKFFVKNIKTGFKIKTILFYPDLPCDRNVIYKIIHQCGYKMTNNPNKKVDMFFFWEDTTFREPDNFLKQTNKKFPVININCKDISKKNVGRVFKKIFNYPLSIDPKKFKGYCVEKPDENATGTGEVIKCPIKKVNIKSSYQKLVDSQNKKGILVDMRVPILKGQIPFIYMRFKGSHEKLIGVLSKGIKLESAENVFSKDEITKIILFCKEIGLEYGELDILRDKKNKKIYIVDANPTPFGPHKMPWEISTGAVKKMSKIFEEVFI